MKKNLVISGGVAVLLFCLFINACKKSDSSYFIAGHIYSGCPSVTTAGIQVELYQEPDSSAGITIGKVLAVETSDASGYFKIKTGFKGKISLRFTDGIIIIPNLNSNDPNHAYLKIYKSFNTLLQVALRPSSPYTNMDTLYTTIPDANGKNIKVIGPFNSSLLALYFTDSLFKSIVRNDDVLTSRPTFSFHINSGAEQSANYSLGVCDTTFAKIVLP